ncbi:acetyltransferase [Aestuariivirga litoralis]|uniref:acetyltransferase n=1 Tax=Aestuariivirga litoralis TaxID=2650924 RepID=UPI0018C4F1FA|nr:acetyltransferase [Aestuariivirga litoralis]MBG1233229.1 acetyltransferase [Aestuariivirga litoralis]
MTERIAIYGADGGREVLPFVKQAFPAADIVYVDDDGDKQGRTVNGSLVMSFEDALDQGRKFSIAIASSVVRRKLAAKINAAGASFISIHAPTSMTYDDVELGEGALIYTQALMTANIRVGQQFHLNIYSYVGHDCRIGDFVTFGPRVNCNGRVIIGDDVYIGTGAVLRQGSHDKPLVIGAGAVIGMGAVVTKDVAPGVTVVGNPARPMERK